MARRVNTRFVFTLGIVLIAAVGVVAFFAITRYRRQHDPVLLEAKGNAAAKTGDLTAEIHWYQMALTECVRRGRNTGDPGVGTMSLALGNAMYEASVNDPQNFRDAMQSWRAAMSADPSLSEPVTRLLHESYRIAQLEPNAANWQNVIDLANRALKMNPKDADALRDRVMAAIGASHPQDMTDAQLAAIGVDVKALEAIEHDDMDVLNAQVQYDTLHAAVLNARNLAGADKIHAQIAQIITQFIAKHPKEAKAYLTQAQYEIATKDMAAAQKSLDTALTLAPQDLELVRFAARYEFALNHRDTAQILLKKLLDLNPASASDAMFVAEVYRRWGRTNDAIDMFQRAVSDKTYTKGVAGAIDRQANVSALYSLCLTYLDQAQELGRDTPKGTDALANANDAATRFRAVQPNSPLLPVLYGGIALYQGKVLDAINQLRKADDYFTGNKQVDSNSLLVKRLLALAYTKTGDTGLALQELDQYAAVAPNDLDVQLMRASLELASMQIDAAVHTSDMLIAARPNDPNVISLRARILQKAGRPVEAAKLLAQNNTAHPDAQTGIQLAMMQLLQQDAGAAVKTLTPVLAKTPADVQAVALMCDALGQLNRKDEAKAVVATALHADPTNYKLASIQAQMDNPKMSLKDLFKEINDKNPDPFARAMQWARFYNLQHDLPNELKSLQDAEKLKPDDPGVIEQIFANALAQKNKDLAQRYVQRAQALNIDGVNGNLYAGRYEYAFGDKDKALDMLQRAVNDRPDYSVGWTIYGLALAQSGKSKDAIDALNKAVDERPDDLLALRALVSLYMSEGGANSRALAAARLEEALRFASSDPQLRNLNDVLGNPQKAIANREAMRAANPNDQDNLFRLAVLYSQTGSPDKAIAILQPLAAKNPTNLQLADALAKMYRDTHQINDALALYEPFLVSKDAKVKLDALLLYGEMQVSLNQIPEAAATFQQAIPLDPHTAALRELAQLKLATGDMAGAETLLQQIQAKEPSVDTLRKLVAAEINQGKYSQADKLLQTKILKDNPNDPQGLALEGFSYFRQRDAKDAMAALNTVLDADPDNVDALYYRALVYAQLLNDRDHAIADLTHVRLLRPHRTDCRLALAELYRADHQFAEASGEYQAILAPDNTPDNNNVRMEYAQFLYGLCQESKQISPDSPSIEAARIRAVKPFDALHTLLTQAVARYPQQPVWPTMLGNLQALAGQPMEAIATLQSTFNATHNPAAGMALINVLMESKQNDQAMDVINQMTRMNPDVPEVYALRGAALSNAGRDADADAAFDKALDLAATLHTNNLGASLAVMEQMQQKLPPAQTMNLLQKRLAAHDNPITRLCLGQYQAMSNQYADAVKTLTPLLADKDASYRLALLRVIAPAEQQTHTPAGLRAAEAQYKEIIQKAPDDMQTVNNLAYLLAQDIGVGLKDPAAIKEAQPYADEAAGLLNQQATPQLYVGANVLDTVGWVRFLGGDLDRSLESLNRSIEMHPLQVAYYHRAQVYAKQDKMDDARDDATTALKWNKQPIDASMALNAQQLLNQMNIKNKVSSDR